MRACHGCMCVSWPATVHWSRALNQSVGANDIKYIWEAARFPHAYHVARAGTLDPAIRQAGADALFSQFGSFVRLNPCDLGPHWASGQEIAVRLIAWTFAVGALSRLGVETGAVAPIVARHALEGAAHVEQFLDYSRRAVYNNHLIAEALALLWVGTLWPAHADASRWVALGRRILNEETDRQFSADGAYIQNSHNYHRVALQCYLLASMLSRHVTGAAPDCWSRAMERSLDFLVAHQNEADGRLPNYGANDGALPALLSTCEFADFRPTLQAASVECRGERLYSPGPWDEEAAWTVGARILDAPLRERVRKSVSFPSGYHVLNGRTGCFGTFRCGSIASRFSQIDMLHLDVWWRGLNVLADGGSYSYCETKWNNHFTRTASHNTIEIDGHDQMVHYRPFKSLYWTRAQTHRFEDAGAWVICEGEHSGYLNSRGVLHRRAVLFLKDDGWVVVDWLLGTGRHTARLHWLVGDCDIYEQGDRSLRLETRKGPLFLTVCGATGRPYDLSVVNGCEEPATGWLSRHYGERVPVPGVTVPFSGSLPAVFVTLLGAEEPVVRVSGDAWRVEASSRCVEFALNNVTHRLERIAVHQHQSPRPSLLAESCSV